MRKVGILEIADPIRDAEVTEVDDRRDVAPPQIVHSQVGKFPVILAGRAESLVQRWTEAEERDAQILDAIEILSPAPIMVTCLHLVDARGAVVDGGDAVFDPRREHEIGYCSLSLLSLRTAVRQPPPLRRRLQTAHRLKAACPVRFPASHVAPT